MKRNNISILFLVLLITGVLLISYGIFSGANTAFSMDTNGLQFLNTTDIFNI